MANSLFYASFVTLAGLKLAGLRASVTIHTLGIKSFGVQCNTQVLNVLPDFRPRVCVLQPGTIIITSCQVF